MDGRQKPDPQTESGNDLDDKEVIELTQIVEEGDGYDVIELNDIIEQPDQLSEAVVGPAEEVIPLVNALPKEEMTDLPEDTDEGIIDLTDVTASPETSAVEPVAESATAPSDDEGEEEVIDLMDVAATPEADVVEAALKDPASMSEESPGTPQDEDDVIDLLDVAATLESDSDGTELQSLDTMPEETNETVEEEDDVIDLMNVATTLEADTAASGMQDSASTPEETAGNIPEDEPIVDLLDAVESQTVETGAAVETDDDFSDLESRAQAVLTDPGNVYDVETIEEAAETAGPESDFMAFDDNAATISEGETPAIADDPPETSPDIPEPAPAAMVVPVSPSESFPLTEAQLEAALSRTIEKIYGEKIEQLMIQTIEKTVTREIARIKNALLEDDDDKVG